MGWVICFLVLGACLLEKVLLWQCAANLEGQDLGSLPGRCSLGFLCRLQELWLELEGMSLLVVCLIDCWTGARYVAVS